MSQFALIPWRQQTLEGYLRLWPDSAVAVLPVLVVHENTMLEAWPSQERIAHLAGISKTTLGGGLHYLVEQGWISLFKRKTRRAWHTVYRMEYRHYRKGEPGAAALFMAIHHDLVLGGLWGRMSGSTKKLYLVLRAHCSMRSEDDHTPFLPAEKILPGEFARLAGVRSATYRKSRTWLLAEMVILPIAEGWYFPLQKVEPLRRVPRTATESTAWGKNGGETATESTTSGGTATESTDTATICTASATESTDTATESTETISSIFSIREEKDSYLPYKLEKRPFPPPQATAHVRNTPNARSHTGQDDGEERRERKRLEEETPFMRLFSQTVDEGELEELRRERRYQNRTLHPPSDKMAYQSL